MGSNGMVQLEVRIVDMMFLTMQPDNFGNRIIMTVTKFWKKRMGDVCVGRACDPGRSSELVDNHKWHLIRVASMNFE